MCNITFQQVFSRFEPAFTFRFEAAGIFLMCLKAQTKVLRRTAAKEVLHGKEKNCREHNIRVGGGICSIPREPLETQDAIESPLIESDFDQSKDMHSLRSGLESTLKKSKDKIIN